MICYRDRTFCNATECAKFDTCDRALTAKVFQEAYKWWGSDDAPIAVCEKFDCFEEKEDK